MVLPGWKKTVLTSPQVLITRYTRTRTFNRKDLFHSQFCISHLVFTTKCIQHNRDSSNFPLPENPMLSAKFFPFFMHGGAAVHFISCIPVLRVGSILQDYGTPSLIASMRPAFLVPHRLCSSVWITFGSSKCMHGKIRVQLLHCITSCLTRA